MREGKNRAVTDPQLKVVKGVFVDFLYAFVEGDGEVCQLTQVTPFIFTLLWRTEDKSVNLGEKATWTVSPVCSILFYHREQR